MWESSALGGEETHVNVRSEPGGSGRPLSGSVGERKKGRSAVLAVSKVLVWC